VLEDEPIFVHLDVKPIYMEDHALDNISIDQKQFHRFWMPYHEVKETLADQYVYIIDDRRRFRLLRASTIKPLSVALNTHGASSAISTITTMRVIALASQSQQHCRRHL
jgi:hypothetical protein